MKTIDATIALNGKPWQNTKKNFTNRAENTTTQRISLIRSLPIHEGKCPGRFQTGTSKSNCWTKALGVQTFNQINKIDVTSEARQKFDTSSAQMMSSSQISSSLTKPMVLTQCPFFRTIRQRVYFLLSSSLILLIPNALRNTVFSAWHYILIRTYYGHWITKAKRRIDFTWGSRSKLPTILLAQRHSLGEKLSKIHYP